MIRYLNINLQLFSEKTEEPTQKKKSDTRKKGNVLQSRELTGAVALYVAVYSISVFSNEMMNILINAVHYYFNLFYTLNFNDYMESYRLFLTVIIFVLKTVMYIIIPVFMTAFLVQRIQVGRLFTADPIKPKLSKINPLEGLKRMFSMQAIMNLLKSLLKIILVGIVGYNYIKGNLGYFMKSYSLNEKQFSYMMAKFSIELALKLASVIIFLGIIDYIYQRYSYNKNLKMSKQEVKDEYKQSEGDPQVKGKIKERQRQAAMRRMMQELPKADVIITNPTHYAVALKYDEDRYDAPYVIAKGQDYVAQKIKEKGRELNIPMVENVPLARALYAQIDIGKMITPMLYEAVAEVLAYIYSLKNDNVTNRR